ncbi:hypothetical protein [Halobacterium noricense]|uniref:hypothetical protein n=1 Tax=Halobacterium noricense TaxID=223182 RepID=UPI001E625F06|nr:hypothetical protein [Halobacterium noricense]UHH26208.1 hypothetical protein LT974_04550 [Halobacterium noricense]
MGITQTLGDALAGRAYQLVGVVFGVAAIAHFALWAQAPDQTLDTAVATGDVSAALPEAVAYAQGHPAYLLAFVVGAVLLVRQP